MKLRELLLRKNKNAKQLATEIQSDEPMVSKYINYKCLPIPKEMLKICEVLDCDIEDIYEPEEIYYQTSNKTKSSVKATKKSDYYNLTVRLPKDAYKYLNKEYLQVCGYKNITQWIWRCYERLQKHHDIIIKKRKAVPDTKRNDSTK